MSIGDYGRIQRRLGAKLGFVDVEMKSVRLSENSAEQLNDELPAGPM